MNQAELEAVLDDYAAAKNRRDVDAILACCHEDCSYASVGLPGRVEGKAALRGFYGALFQALPDYRGDFDGRAFSGDRVAVWGRFSGTVHGEFFGAPATGQRIEVPVVFLCGFTDGLISSDVGYFDAAGMYEQAGVPFAGLRSPRDAEASEKVAENWVEQWANAWSQPSPQGLGELLAPDIDDVREPFMGHPASHADVVAHFARTLEALPDLRLEVLDWAVRGDTVLIEWSASASVEDERLTWQGTDRFTLRDGQAVVEHVYYDTHPIREALLRALDSAQVSASV